MAKSINKVILVGNVGSDPEIRSTSGGTRVASISLATSRRWGRGDEMQERTQWHRIIAWNAPRGQQLADIVDRYVKKGQQLYVEGRLEYRSYTGQDGQEKWVTEIVASEILMLGGKPAGATGREPARVHAGGELPYAESGDFEEEDDIPF